jgi:hypothetical protein
MESWHHCGSFEVCWEGLHSAALHTAGAPVNYKVCGGNQQRYWCGGAQMRAAVMMPEIYGTVLYCHSALQPTIWYLTLVQALV